MAEPGFTPVGASATPGFTPVAGTGQPPLQATPPGFGPGGAMPAQTVQDAGSAVSDWLHSDSIIPKSWTQDHPIMGAIMKSFDIANTVPAMATGGKNLVKGLYGMGKDLVQNPNWVMGPNSTYEKFSGAPSADQAKQATEAYKQGRYSEAAGHELAGALPFGIGSYGAHLGERAGTGDVGGALSEGLGTMIAAEALPKAAAVPGDAYRYTRDLANRARSLDDVSNAASAVHNVVQKNLQTTVASLRAEGARATEQAVQADVARDKAAGTVGSISTGPAIMGGIDAMQKVGFRVGPDTAKAISKLGKAPRNLTLEEAMNLRTGLGDSLAKAKDAESRMVLGAAREELDESIGQRFEQLIGNRKPWNYRNAKFAASYNIQDVFENVLNSPNNPYDSINRMDDFSKLNLDELKREMQSQGLMDQYGQLEAAKDNAGRLARANETMNKKMGMSLFKMSTVKPGPALAGITAYVALHPVAGLASYMLGTLASNALAKLSAANEVGRIGRQYGDPISSIRTSGPVQNFNYPSPPAGARPMPPSSLGGSPAAVGAGSPKGGSPTPSPSSASPAATVATEARPRMSPAEAQEAARKLKMGKDYTPSSAARADVEQKIKKLERAKRLREKNKGPLKEGDAK